MKKQSLMRTINLFLVLGIFLIGISCSKDEMEKESILKGKLVGYLKCSDHEKKNTLLGFFIISNSNDSLLSFNVPSLIYNLDTSKITYGINFFNGDSISFNCRDVENDELKQFDCPPATMQDPTFYPIENFSQVIITNISKIP